MLYSIDFRGYDFKYDCWRFGNCEIDAMSIDDASKQFPKYHIGTYEILNIVPIVKQ